MSRERAVLNENSFAGLMNAGGDPVTLAALLDETGDAAKLAGAGLSEPEIASRAAGEARDPLWWTVLASFMEGFGAYSLAPYAIAGSQDGSGGAISERLPHDAGEPAVARRRREAMFVQDSGNVIRIGPQPAQDRRPWFRRAAASLSGKATALWSHWRREREIRRAVAALDQFDDRTLRDIGIRSRSEIEHVVRYCHDC